LEASQLRVAYGTSIALADCSLALPAGQVTALIGPNGSGKSTALKTLARLQSPTGGAVYLNGCSIAKHSTRAIARQVAILPQSPQIPDGVTVWELIGYGRYPHRGLQPGRSRADRAAMQWALEAAGLAPLAQRSVDSLSGGERQRAWIALALAQQTPILLLDEPTTFLDLRHQMEVLALVRRLNRERGLTVGWVLHDLNQAAAYSDRLIALQAGRIVTSGPPRAVMAAATLREVFEVEVDTITHPRTGLPVCLPYPRGASANEA
jgi:iron complex transport system ATP-binding protein